MQWLDPSIIGILHTHTHVNNKKGKKRQKNWGPFYFPMLIFKIYSYSPLKVKVQSTLFLNKTIIEYSFFLYVITRYSLNTQNCLISLPKVVRNSCYHGKDILHGCSNIYIKKHNTRELNGCEINEMSTQARKYCQFLSAILYSWLTW